MDPSDFDDTDMSSAEFDRRMDDSQPAQVSNLASIDWQAPHPVETGSSAVTTSASVTLAGNVTITRTLELAGT